MDKVQIYGVNKILVDINNNLELFNIAILKKMIFEKGYGDYSQERSGWLEEQSLDDIVKRIQEKRNQ